MTDPDDAPADSDDAPEPLYPDVQSWVENVYVTTFIRPENQQIRWCASWWAHPEAIIRFTALWQTWEAARLIPGSGMADWLRIYLDSLAPVLHSPAGPFASCTAEKHREQQLLVNTEPPLAYWD